MEIRYVEDPKINERVTEIIEELKEEIVSRYHPKSIIVSGSFGRGEATVIEEDGKLRFLSDCEVILIPYKWIFNRRKISQFEQEFYEKHGLKIEIWGFTPTLYLSIPFLNKRIKPTISNYDLKYGSKVIYGKNYLDKIPDFKPEDIPLCEGIRLLFNRMAEALEHFSLGDPSKEMIFWTDKIVLACQDALLLSLGEYHYSHRKKNEMFQNLFPNYFVELEGELPNFLRLTTEATERKLNGVMNVEDPIKYWFDIAKMCDKIFRYIIKIDMGIEFEDYLEFQEKYLRYQTIRKCSQGFFSQPICENFKSFMKMFIIFRIVPPRALMRKIRIPWKHIVYSAIPLLYFSLVDDKVIDYHPKDTTKSGSIKKHVLYLWKAICY